MPQQQQQKHQLLLLILNASTLLIAFANVVGCYLSENKNEYESLLIKELFVNYNNKLRPTATVQIKFALNLNQIINVVEKDQTMIINAFVDHKWVDKRLAWEPKDYGNLTVIRVNGEQIWTPDTFIYTTAEKNGLLVPQSSAYFVVSNEGEIFWPNPLNNLKVRCSMDILWFPFDEQICGIVFGSWSYTQNYLNYSILQTNTTLDSYTENNVWQLVDYKSVRREEKYTAWIEEDSFSEIVYKLHIRRKPLFVIQNCVIPALMLCILSLVSFFIPFAPKMQIGISIMLAFSVFKLRLSDDVPVQSDIIPLINVYFTLCMSFSLSCMVWFSLKNILTENRKVPRWIRYLVLNYIWYFLCLNIFTIFLRDYHHNSNSKSRSRSHQHQLKSQSQSSFDKTHSSSRTRIRKSNISHSMSSFGSKFPSQLLDDSDQARCYEIDHRGNKNLLIRIRQLKNNSNSNLEIINGTKLINANKNLVRASRIEIEHEDSHRQNESKYVVTSENENEQHLLLIKADNRGKYDETNNEQQIRVKTGSILMSSPSKQIDQSSSNNQRYEDDDHDANDKDAHEDQEDGEDVEEPKKQIKKQKKQPLYHIKTKAELSDLEIAEILNAFVFIIFLVFIILLNLLSLYIFPYYIKKSLKIND